MRISHRVFLAGVACASALVIALSVAYYSTASASTVRIRVVPADVPPIAAEKARSEGVSSLEFLSTAEGGHLGVVLGSNGGASVAAFASRAAVTPFARLATVAKAADITVLS